MTLRVKVPASTSNLGSGFDCFGLALQLYLTVTFKALSNGYEISVAGEGSASLPNDKSNLVVKSAARLYDSLGLPMPGLRMKIENEIPISRGLGSSGAAIVAGLIAARKLIDESVTEAHLLSLAAELEGHPENAAASLLGGLTINCTEAGRIEYRRIPVEGEIEAVILVPKLAVSTAEARRLLPLTVAHQDAVFNLQRSAFLTHAFVTKDYDALRYAMQDRLHQPYRKTLFPYYDRFESIGYENGALGICISGSGSAILSLTKDCERLKVCWQNCIKTLGMDACVLALGVDNEGARVEEVTDHERQTDSGGERKKTRREK